MDTPKDGDSTPDPLARARAALDKGTITRRNWSALDEFQFLGSIAKLGEASAVTLLDIAAVLHDINSVLCGIDSVVRDVNSTLRDVKDALATRGWPSSPGHPDS